MSDIEEMAKEFSLALRLGDEKAAEMIARSMLDEARLYPTEMGALGDVLEKLLVERDWSAVYSLGLTMAKKARMIDVANHDIGGYGLQSALLHADLAYRGAGFLNT